MKVLQDGPGGANERRAKGGKHKLTYVTSPDGARRKPIEFTTCGDPRRVFLHDDNHLYYADGSLAEDRSEYLYREVMHASEMPQFENRPPPPSALDSIWQAIWKLIKAAW